MNLTNMISNAYAYMSNAYDHVSLKPEQLAEKLGFLEVNGKTRAQTREAKDGIASSLADSREKIEIFQNYAGWQVDEMTDQGSLPANFDINAPIRRENGQEIRWLDVAHEIKDVAFQYFLLENGADLTQCHPDTQRDLTQLNNKKFLNVNSRTGAQTRAAAEAITSVETISEQKIEIFQNYAGWLVDPVTNQGSLPADFEINAPIRIIDGQEIRWLDVAHDSRDVNFQSFLLENGADLTQCHANTRRDLANLAMNIGFQGIGTKTPEEIRTLHEDIARPNNEARRIDLLKEIGYENESFSVDINRPFRVQGGTSYRWLDLAIQANDRDLAFFLLGKGAISDQCSTHTQDTVRAWRVEQAAQAAQAGLDAELLPNRAGAQVNAGQFHDNAEMAAAQNGNSTLYKVGKLFLCSPLIAAGAVLYVTPMIFNAVISTAYITAQGFASIGALPAYAIDKTIWAGINLVRTNVFHYEKADTRYYFTKTIGGAACVMGLVAVAVCTNNPVSIGLRRVFLSGPAYLGASLISWSCHSSPIDERGYDAILADYNARFETSQPDMQWKNWEKIMIFTAKLATNRGFKESYHNTFHNPAAPLGDDQAAAPNPDYPGFIRGTLASFAMRIYP